MDLSDKNQHEIIRAILDDNPNNRSPKQIASFFNCAVSTVLKWGEDPDGSGFPIPSQKMLPLMFFTGDLRLLKWMALQMNYRIVPLEKTKDSNGILADDILKIDTLRGLMSDVLQGFIDAENLNTETKKQLSCLAAEAIESFRTLMAELKREDVKFA